MRLTSGAPLLSVPDATLSTCRSHSRDSAPSDPAPDLERATQWWTDLLGVAPYFDQPFYVGFNVGGHELGLPPNADLADGAMVYWGVPDVVQAVDVATAAGSTEHTPAADVGDGIVTATVRTPDGTILGLIFNPNFTLG